MAYNALLTGDRYEGRFCEKMKRSGMHKSERSSGRPGEATC